MRFLMGFLGVPLVNGVSDRGFNGVLMGFLGVPWVNGGRIGVYGGLWGGRGGLRREWI